MDRKLFKSKRNIRGRKAQRKTGPGPIARAVAAVQKTVSPLDGAFFAYVATEQRNQRPE